MPAAPPIAADRCEMGDWVTRPQGRRSMGGGHEPDPRRLGAERRQPHRHGHHPRSQRLIQSTQIWHMRLRDDGQMTERHWPDVHDGENLVIVMDDADFAFISDDRADDAVRR